VGSGQESAQVGKLIKEQLLDSTPEPTLFVLEYIYASKGDPFLATWELPFFTVGNEVYLFADADSSTDQIRKILGEAHVYPAIGVVSRIPKRHSALRRGDGADPRLLPLLAEGTRHLIIGAYDAEGWLIWSR
jgi:hypothetical protein